MILFKRYEVEKLLGRGSAGEVYLCRDTLIGSLRVAVKVLPPWLLDKPKQRARIAAEVLALRSFKSPFIVHVSDFCHNHECTAIVMEYVEGETLRALLDSDKSISKEKKFSLARKLIQGVTHIHERGLIHRDIKPENIIISTDGNLKIIDFGLITSNGTVEAQAIRETSNSKSPAGTSFYMPPEILMGEKISQQADVYSTTMVLFELFFRADLFESKGIVELIEDKSLGKYAKVYQTLPDILKEFIDTGIAPKRDIRFKDAGAMLKAFDKIALEAGMLESHQIIEMSRRPTSSCAIDASSTRAVSGAIYRSVKTVEFSYDKFQRSKSNLRRWLLPFFRTVGTCALIGMIGLGILYVTPASSQILATVQNFIAENTGTTINDYKVPEGYRVISSRSPQLADKE